ncbi:MAG TPA: hypothetical protein VFN60_06620, partial [Acidimicrobiales bacterium]|nr:hypothetical protein [Acidimicrobiales bacterium]
MPETLASLRSIGAALAGIGKSGLLGPFTPAQVARVAAGVAGDGRRALSVGAVYRLAAALDPSAAAVVDDAGAVGFADMDRQAGAVAAGLADLGVGEGD